MLEGLKRIAPIALAGLAVLACGDKDTREIQIDTNKRVVASGVNAGCQVVCESKSPFRASSAIACNPSLEGEALKKAEETAKAIWEHIPKDKRPECPPMRSFDGTFML